jgi:hypothetical protein
MTLALAYNLWSLFVRVARPQARMKAITIRPSLLSAIGRMISHAGQTHLSITPLHTEATHAQALLTAGSQRLQDWKRSAEQLPVVSVWHRETRNRNALCFK